MLLKDRGKEASPLLSNVVQSDTEVTFFFLPLSWLSHLKQLT